MSKKVDEAKERYRAADQRVKDLAQELKDLPVKIEQAAREEVTARGRAALAGEDVGAVTGTAVASKVGPLRERQENIRYEIWAARIHRGEAFIAYLEAQLEDAEREAGEFRGKLEAAEEALKKAQGEYRRAVDAHYVAANHAQGLRTTLRRERQGAEQLKSEGPRVVA